MVPRSVLTAHGRARGFTISDGGIVVLGKGTRVE